MRRDAQGYLKTIVRPSLHFSSPSIGSEASTSLSRSLTMRLETLKSQYQHDLIPLTDERGSLLREIAELKAARDTFLEETTMLNARNEELAQLHAIYIRRTENAAPIPEPLPAIKEKPSQQFDRPATAPSTVLQPSNAANAGGLTADDSVDSSPFVKVQKPTPAEMMAEPPGTLRGKFKWLGNNKETGSTPLVTTPVVDEKKGRINKLLHSFQQVSVLRVTRCDHCGDKLWGSQARCTGA